MKVKYVLFDWGGTLGLSGRRQKFIRARTPVKQKSHLQSGTLKLLKGLRAKRIPMGILSNTQVSAKDMRKGIRDAGMDHFFSVQVYSSEPQLICKKPCENIFQFTLSEIQKKHPKLNIKASDVLYVGDSYGADVWGAWNAGMKSAYITNGNLLSQAATYIFDMHDIAIDNMDDLLDNV